ncbi:N-acetyl-alpha-D-glucosaminyl L-malate synthase BshA [Geomicrobium sp. JCM 19039]|uniref:N-acetyl-alpha-D-glucosaminyl L-malate synthase BshA n=1 Tax=Geomicrobium sp. JCM 19039 TaxID=1460636 RepID=UPI00045F13A1|nr:N-acetyl-alpha-D-glucosaminyl L-malate synthase BshA [Geomicrobium sp. JCM 19039]GAK11196.1 glycosyltransferase, group 1 family protein [Geomicrobium sp. JCM 19039]
MRPLKIGITCYPTVGGSGVVATELGIRLAERGHEIHFITSSLPFRLQQVHPNIFFHEVVVNQYQVFRYPPYDLTLASKMAEVARKHELDLLHVHYAVPHAISASLAKDMLGGDVKVMTTLHGTDITVLAEDPSLANIIEHGINRSDQVTAVSDFLVKQTYDMLDIKNSIDTVYNFVDERELVDVNRHLIREQFNIQDDEKVIVHMSNFRGVKRVDDVIRAFALIQSQVKSKLYLIGDGPDRHVMETLVKSLGLDDCVFFLGNQMQVFQLLAIGDVKLLLSEKESFGLAALEAMSVGVPVIGANIGGISEVVVHEETGIIVPVYEYEQAAEEAVRLLADKETWQRYSANSRKRALTNFSKDVIVPQYEALYYRMLQDACH